MKKTRDSILYIAESWLDLLTRLCEKGDVVVVIQIAQIDHPSDLAPPICDLLNHHPDFCNVHGVSTIDGYSAVSATR
jgi:hypothetical protein